MTPSHVCTGICLGKVSFRIIPEVFLAWEKCLPYGQCFFKEVEQTVSQTFYKGHQDPEQHCIVQKATKID